MDFNNYHKETFQWTHHPVKGVETRCAENVI